MKKHFSGLFEDEVAEELRTCSRSVLIRSGHASWRPSKAIHDDGWYSTGAGWYSFCVNNRPAGTVNARFLVNWLAHTEFTIEED